MINTNASVQLPQALCTYNCKKSIQCIPIFGLRLYLDNKPQCRKPRKNNRYEKTQNHKTKIPQTFRILTKIILQGLQN